MISGTQLVARAKQQQRAAHLSFCHYEAPMIRFEASTWSYNIEPLRVAHSHWVATFSKNFPFFGYILKQRWVRDGQPTRNRKPIGERYSDSSITFRWHSFSSSPAPRLLCSSFSHSSTPPCVIQSQLWTYCQMKQESKFSDLAPKASKWVWCFGCAQWYHTPPTLPERLFKLAPIWKPRRVQSTAELPMIKVAANEENRLPQLTESKVYNVRSSQVKSRVVWIWRDDRAPFSKTADNYASTIITLKSVRVRDRQADRGSLASFGLAKERGNEIEVSKVT